MAFIQCDFFSNTLGMHMMMNVILPQANTTHIGTKADIRKNEGCRVMYLLHGMSDDHTIWSRLTSVERYVLGKNLAVIMPCAHRSYYTNMHSGKRYWDYIAIELPAVVKELFRVSDRREDTFACGLSMGGYGALKLGLAMPENFNAVCGISSVADINNFQDWREDSEWAKEEFAIFGPKDRELRKPNDLFFLAEQYKKKNLTTPTRFMQICVTEDFLYQDNLRLRDHFKNINLPCKYSEEPGSHTWEFWDRHVRNAIDFFLM